jgi:hypothetical protein
MYSYTYGDGRTVDADTFPPTDTGIVELVFKAGFGARPHLSNAEQEKAVLALPPALRVLRAEKCKLRTWPNLPLTIEECYLDSNHYLRVPDLSMYRNLIVLELNDNSIEAIENPLPPMLARLNLDCNALRRFVKALIPPSCANISTFSNPVDFNWTRPRARAIAVEEEPRPKNVYVNAHNIHDSGVQKSTKANIHYLVNYRNEVPEDADLWASIDRVYSGWSDDSNSCCLPFMSKKPSADLPGSILRTYGTNPYVMHGVTFTKLVDRVWLRIIDIPDKEKKTELLKRFKEEVEDGKTHCTNGMMVRMSNVFLGFDENIVVKLNANQVLSARIPASQERIRKAMGERAGPEGNETNEFWVAVYKETIKDLEDLEVDESDWGTWLSTLAEPVLDNLFEKQGWKDCPKKSRPPEDLPTKSEGMSLRKYIQSTGLSGYPFEMKYLLDLWSS